MTYGINKGNTRPAGRTAFADNVPVRSKNTSRYGEQGSKSEFPESSTGENPAKQYRDDVAPSAPSHSITARAVEKATPEGFATDGSGRFLESKHPNTGKHDGGHIPARVATTDDARGQMYPASGGQFGLPTKRPAAASNTGTNTEHPASLNGDADPRVGYDGGRGKI